MKKKQPLIIYWLLPLLLFVSLACNSLSGIGQEATAAGPTPVVLEKPLSSIEPLPSATVNNLGDRVSLAVGEELILRSRHLSQNELDTLNIWVNDQPANEFPAELGQLEVVFGGQFLGADKIRRAFSGSEWTVRLRWVGRVPGTYEIKLEVVDAAGHSGEPVRQRVEVR